MSKPNYKRYIRGSIEVYKEWNRKLGFAKHYPDGDGTDRYAAEDPEKYDIEGNAVLGIEGIDQDLAEDGLLIGPDGNNLVLPKLDEITDFQFVTIEENV
jgi:hypothetical protein